MNFLKNIAGRIMAFWALLVFISTMFVFVIPIAITGFWHEPKRSGNAFIFQKAWMDVFFFLVGIRRIIKG
ncbi:MAG: 1-acyl-sn-glycerol-3-phosphate acyltransferase, partial [Bacteroidota bacterium]|nr:1-acyl-sn-glycerol-3-phosphate acyltransferase [Bacteroidota bacterium]